eukprot:SAG22_NODE_99_length_20560_cov_128.669029_13_plen_87_part_00
MLRWGGGPAKGGALPACLPVCVSGTNCKPWTQALPVSCLLTGVCPDLPSWGTNAGKQLAYNGTYATGDAVVPAGSMWAKVRQRSCF